MRDGRILIDMSTFTLFLFPLMMLAFAMSYVFDVVSGGYFIVGNSFLMSGFSMKSLFIFLLKQLIPIAAMVAFWNSSIRFGDNPTPNYLRSKPNVKVIQDFVATNTFEQLPSSKIMLACPNGKLYPVCFFTRQILNSIDPAAVLYAWKTYKRVNDTLAMRLKHLKKYVYGGNKVLSDELIHELKSEADSLFTELTSSDAWNGFASNASQNIHERNYECLDINKSAAAGHPHVPGVKRRDVMPETFVTCDELLDDDYAFERYMPTDLYYTSGRAKLKGRNEEDSARIVMYCGFPTMVMTMLYYVHLTTLLMTFQWCGIGKSWMNNGANKFAEFFHATKGIAPAGMRYVSVDISGYDSSQSVEELNILKDFHTRLQTHARIQQSYINRFIVMFDAMVYAAVLLPTGIVLRVVGGLKSGWSGTACDDTLLHTLIVRRLGVTKFRVYGDDNFMLVSDDITDEDITDHYAKFGYTLKVIQSSTNMGDIDFLSKYVKYDAYADRYYIHRPTVENIARLIFPEEQDPARRDVPDEVIAAQRLIGHLVDNPFNSKCSGMILKALDELREYYAIDDVIISEDTKRRHPFRNFVNVPSKINLKDVTREPALTHVV
uniref:RdRp catalytic domain-containing protein n=1 Tax=viral metagenome TaxID=1070528 RepID=A0A2V0RBL1_9ZZZZ